MVARFRIMAQNDVSHRLSFLFWHASFSFRWRVTNTVRSKKFLSTISLVTLFCIFGLYYKGKHSESTYSCLIVLRKSDGRLGNHMFMYSSAYGLAKKKGCLMHVEPLVLENLASIFNIKPAKWAIDEQTIGFEKIRKIFNGCRLEYVSLSKAIEGKIELTGYWQSYKYFQDCLTDVLHQFTFRKSVMHRVEQHLQHQNDSVLREIGDIINVTYRNSDLVYSDVWERQKILKTIISERINATIIGLHIRRSDFIEKLHLGFAVSSLDYILRGISFFSEKYSNPLFIVSSDDKNWCHSNLGHRPNIVFTPDGMLPHEDMALLSLCQHSLITTGTFGWWAATLAQGTTVCDGSYPRNGSWLSDLCPAEHYLPPWFHKL